MNNKDISMTSANNETTDLTSIISSNLRKLINEQKTTQKELADKLGVAPASMTDYCKGRRVPNVEFLVSLKNLYDISIDDFLTKSINPTSKVLTSNQIPIDDIMLTTYRKYCGSYFVYYFDTSKYKGRDSQPPKDSLIYGVMYIYENPSSLNNPEYSCAAILGIKTRDEVTLIKKNIENITKSSEVVDYISTRYPNNAYFGDFELSQEHAFISIDHANTDKALIIYHRVDNNKPDYTGGIGTINSVSKGRERMPVVQFMGISRHPLTLSIEEIHHSLLLNYPTFKAEKETEEMIKDFKALYVNPDESNQGFSELQKSIVVRSNLERYIKKSVENNMFRYGKISERDDDEWYHSIKSASIDENE